MFQMTPLALQCESQICERRSKHPSVLTWVCSQIRPGVPVPLTHQRLTILPVQGPADFLQHLTIVPAHGPLAFYSVSQFYQRTVRWFSTAAHSTPSLQGCRHTADTPPPRMSCLLLTALYLPLCPHQPSVRSSYFSSASRHFPG